MTIKSFFAQALLPSTMTAFERKYLARMNRVALIFFALHVPVFAAIAFFNDTNPLQAIALTLLAMVGPVVADRTLKNPRLVSNVFGVTAMFMGALLVHFGRGLWTIEMHFYFFVALALLAVFANPMVIITAAVTVALHHLALWFVAPTSVFNYDAPVSSVLVHAGFVVLESVAACFVARSFFDNVIGLELIVAARTSELDAKNQEMALVFEHVQQGFLTANAKGELAAQHSKVVREWLSAPVAGEKAWDLFMRVDPVFARWLEVGWDMVVDGLLPRDVALDQLPKRIETGGRIFEVTYQAIDGASGLEQVLFLITDATARVAREQAEMEQRETLQVFEKLMKDRSAFLDFFTETREQIDALKSPDCALPQVVQLRMVHTIKGNCALFGVQTVSAMCHTVENRVAEHGNELSATDRAELARAWSAASARVVRFLQGQRRAVIELEETDFVAVVRAIDSGAARAEIRKLVESWRLEPVQRPFERLGEQAQALAHRLGKPLTVALESEDVRLPRGPMQKLWSSCVHLVRNAVDHGLGEKGGQLRLKAHVDGNDLVLSFIDNGRGIDWDSVERSAKAKGIPCSSRTDLEAALFVDGLSTREEATEISGRGVGLSAVMQAVRELQGSIRITSAPGQGSRFDLHFPTAMLTDGSGADGDRRVA